LTLPSPFFTSGCGSCNVSPSTKGDLMRVLIGFVLALLVATSPLTAQSDAKAKATTPAIPSDSVPNFLKMPAGTYMGEAVGVATKSKGHVFTIVRRGDSSAF